MVHIFVLGATGYVGGTALKAILKDAPQDWRITVLIRNESLMEGFKALGITVAIGALDDLEIIRTIAESSDVVCNFASSDHPASTEAIITGLKKRREEIKPRKPIHIHTSGTGVLIDANNPSIIGEPSDKVYRDEITEDFTTIPAHHLHRNVDALIEASSDQIDNIIVVPPAIWGKGSGLGNRESIQLPGIIKAAIQLKKVHRIGRGLNRWHQIHVEDLAELYRLLLDGALHQRVPVGKQGYYLAENGDFAWGDVCVAIAQSLQRLGLTSTDEIGIASEEDWEAKFPGVRINAVSLFGSNSRGIGTKAKSLGWNPTRSSNEQFFTAIARDVEEHAKLQ
eukprot:TRINITY_DN103_c0_g1_i1.p1 TRINITY_DN103_c0_g1~~TRINITY_DN103_c0_g1_i1.p1  ORF type:complete len:338 (-),score=78.81 TRINITY_DN103_c0_g1_i1:51-1064(-)